MNVITSDNCHTAAIMVDASTGGIGFYADKPSEEFAVGSRIIMYVSNQNKPVYGKVVYSKALGALSRIGTSLDKKAGYKKYKKGLTVKE